MIHIERHADSAFSFIESSWLFPRLQRSDDRCLRRGATSADDLSGKRAICERDESCEMTRAVIVNGIWDGRQDNVLNCIRTPANGSRYLTIIRKASDPVGRNPVDWIGQNPRESERARERERARDLVGDTWNRLCWWQTVFHLLHLAPSNLLPSWPPRVFHPMVFPPRLALPFPFPSLIQT